MVHKGGAKPGSHTTRNGFLDGHPTLIRAIIEQLTMLRAAGVPVSVDLRRPGDHAGPHSPLSSNPSQANSF
ncbi:hypothetical protein PENSPDRAFT_695089 [Peniophora sp. CONT]|nr:hypothetical protein PENSPDRAFT_695089 [Peniophora sp. CONT]